jgi:hypothetical protein
LRFFIDNCISINLAEGIRVLAQVQEYEIVHLSEKFPADAPDLDWIPALSEEGDWVIVSGDPRISRSKAERAAWQESGLTAFFFSDGFPSKRYWKQAEILVHWWPLIVLKARQVPAGSGFLMPLSGKDLKEIYSPPS